MSTEKQVLVYIEDCEKTFSRKGTLGVSHKYLSDLLDKSNPIHDAKNVTPKTLDRLRVVHVCILDTEIWSLELRSRQSETRAEVAAKMLEDVIHKKRIRELLLLEISDLKHLKPEEILWAGKRLADTPRIQAHLKGRIFLRHLATQSSWFSSEAGVSIQAAKDELKNSDKERKSATPFYENLNGVMKTLEEKGQEFITQSLDQFEALLGNEKSFREYLDALSNSENSMVFLPSPQEIILLAESKEDGPCLKLSPAVKARANELNAALEVRIFLDQYQKAVSGAYVFWDPCPKTDESIFRKQMRNAARRVKKLRLLGLEVCHELDKSQDYLWAKGDLETFVATELGQIDVLLSLAADKDSKQSKAILKKRPFLPTFFAEITRFIQKEGAEKLSDETKDRLHALHARYLYLDNLNYKGIYSSTWSMSVYREMMLAASHVKELSLLDPKIEEEFMDWEKVINAFKDGSESAKLVVYQGLEKRLRAVLEERPENYIKSQLDLLEKSISAASRESAIRAGALQLSCMIKFIEGLGTQKIKILTDEVRDRLYALGAYCYLLNGEKNQAIIKTVSQVKDFRRLKPGVNFLLYENLNDSVLKWQYLWAATLEVFGPQRYFSVIKQVGSAEKITGAATAYLKQHQTEVSDQKNSEKEDEIYRSAAQDIVEASTHTQLNDQEIEAIAYLSRYEKNVAPGKAPSSDEISWLLLFPKNILTPRTFDRMCVLQARMIKLNPKAFHSYAGSLNDVQDEIESRLLEIHDPRHLRPEDVLWVGELLANSGIRAILKGREFLRFAQRLIPIRTILDRLKKRFDGEGEKFLIETLDQHEALLRDEKRLKNHLATFSAPEELRAFYQGSLDIVALAESKEDGPGLQVSPEIKDRARDLYYVSKALVYLHLGSQDYTAMLTAARAVKKIQLLGPEINNAMKEADATAWRSQLWAAMREDPEGFIREALVSIEALLLQKTEDDNEIREILEKHASLPFNLGEMIHFVKNGGGVKPETADRLYVLLVQYEYLNCLVYHKIGIRGFDGITSTYQRMLDAITSVTDLHVFDGMTFPVFDKEVDGRLNIIHRVVLGVRTMMSKAEEAAKAKAKPLMDSKQIKQIKGEQAMAEERRLLAKLKTEKDVTDELGNLGRRLSNNDKAELKREAYSLPSPLAMLAAAKENKLELSQPIKDRAYALEAYICELKGETAGMISAGQAVVNMHLLDKGVNDKLKRMYSFIENRARYQSAMEAGPKDFIEDSLRDIEPLLQPIPNDPKWAPKDQKQYAKYLDLSFSLRDMIEYVEEQKIDLPPKTKDQLYALEARYCYIEYKYNRDYGKGDVWKAHHRLMLYAAHAVSDKSCLDVQVLKEFDAQTKAQLQELFSSAAMVDGVLKERKSRHEQAAIQKLKEEKANDPWEKYLVVKDQKEREGRLVALMGSDPETFVKAKLDEIEEILPCRRWRSIDYERNFLLQIWSIFPWDVDREVWVDLKKYLKVECFVPDVLQLTKKSGLKLSDTTLDRLRTLKARSCYRRSHVEVGKRDERHYAEAMEAVSAMNDLSRLDGDIEISWGEEAKGEALKRRHVRLAKKDQGKFVEVQLDYVEKLLPQAEEPNFFSKDVRFSSTPEQRARFSQYHNFPFSLSDTIELLESKDGSGIVLSKDTRDRLYALEARCCYLDGDIEGMIKAAAAVDASLLDPKVREARAQSSSKDEEKGARHSKQSNQLCVGEARKLEREIEALESQPTKKRPLNLDEKLITQDTEKDLEASQIIIRKRKDIQQLLMEIDDPSQLSPEDLLWVGESLAKDPSVQSYVKACEYLNLAKTNLDIRQKADEKLKELGKKSETNAFYRGIVTFAKTLKDQEFIQDKLNEVRDALTSEEGFERYLKSSSSKFSPLDIFVLSAHLGWSLPAIKEQARDLNNALQARISWRKHEATADQKAKDRHYVEMIDAGLAVKNARLLGPAVNGQLMQYATDPALKARYWDAMGNAKNLVLRLVQMDGSFEQEGGELDGDIDKVETTTTSPRGEPKPVSTSDLLDVLDDKQSVTLAGGPPALPGKSESRATSSQNPGFIAEISVAEGKKKKFVVEFVNASDGDNLEVEISVDDSSLQRRPPTTQDPGTVVESKQVAKKEIPWGSGWFKSKPQPLANRGQINEELNNESSSNAVIGGDLVSADSFRIKPKEETDASNNGPT